MHYIKAFILFMFTLLCGAALAFSAQEKQDIEKITHDYLIKNPDVLMESMQVLKTRQMQTVIQQNSEKLFSNTHTPTLGNPNGKIVVVEFFDFQCGYCKKSNNMINHILKKNNNVRFVSKILPIFGPESEYAAAAALAANQQHKYAVFHDALMESAAKLNQTVVLDIAKKAGLDTAALEKDLKNDAIGQEIKTTNHLAEILGFNFTPVFIIGPYPGPASKTSEYQIIPGAPTEADLQKAIDAFKGH